jgi:hypothetical protein
VIVGHPDSQVRLFLIHGAMVVLVLATLEVMTQTLDITAESVKQYISDTAGIATACVSNSKETTKATL